MRQLIRRERQIELAFEGIVSSTPAPGESQKRLKTVLYMV